MRAGERQVRVISKSIWKRQDADCRDTRQVYQKLSEHESVRFPIKKAETPTDKVSLLVQVRSPNINFDVTMFNLVSLGCSWRGSSNVHQLQELEFPAPYGGIKRDAPCAPNDSRYSVFDEQFIILNLIDIGIILSLGRYRFGDQKWGGGYRWNESVSVFSNCLARSTTDL
jgi:hypothetical protein